MSRAAAAFAGRRILPALLLLSSFSVGWLICGSASFAADWPTYLNSPARIGATEETLPLPLKPLWTHTSAAPLEMSWAGPRKDPIEGLVERHRSDFDAAIQVAAVGDAVYFGSPVDHKLYCVDAQSGQPRWTLFTDGPIRLAPTVWQGKVLFGSDDGMVYCLDAAAGSLVWKLRVGPADERLLARGMMISRWPVRTGVTVDGGVAFFAAGVFPHETVYLAAADAATGKLLWKNDHISQEDAGRNPLSPQGYLLVSAEQLFVPSGRALPAAFDRRTGEEQYQKNVSWRGAAGGTVGGTRALLGDGQLYCAGDHHFLALNQQTGAAGFAFIAGHQLTLSGDKCFAADGKHIAAMSRLEHAAATTERQKLWLAQNDLKANRAKYEPGEYRQREADLAAQIAKLSAVGVLWKAPSDCDGALIVAGEHVIAGGKGQVLVLSAADGTPVWNAAIEDTATGLAVANGRLYVSTDTGRILAFGAAASAPATPANLPASLAKEPFAKDELSAMYAAAAEQILSATGVQRGFCLVVGAEQCRLAFELAKRSELRIYGIESDAEKVAAGRKALDAAGLHATRVTLVHGDPAKMPFSNYFANLVVSDTLLLTGQLPGAPGEIARCVKPCGGIAWLGGPASAPAVAAGRLSAEKLQAAIAETELARAGETTADAASIRVSRGKLPGVGEWSHQYGDAANTSCSQDQRVKGGMSVLWYGDPGPAPMINRHEAAAAPLSTNGRMFIQGLDNVMCYDAYNGLFLWEHKNPGAIRTGVFNNEETSNLAASDDALFIAVGEKCTMLDAATGAVRHVFTTPPSDDKLPRAWGYVAHWNGLLFGTSTMRRDLTAALKRRGHTVENQTDAIFAHDLSDNRRLWTYRGPNIMHMTIAVGDDRVYFIESTLSPEQRAEILRQDKTELANLPPDEAKKKEEELKRQDVRTAVCLDARTGEKLWAKPVDVTDCSYVGIGGGQLTLIYHDNHVLVCGANANGHYWKQFLSGQFSRRRLVTLDAKTGDTLWSKDANYRHRPIVIGDEIFAEPWAFALHTGDEKKRENPLTGQETAWQFSRPGHHCGPLTATPNTLFFRSGSSGYYDLYSDSGTSHFAGHRTGCWVNMLPGNGLLMIPEASAGCVCQFSIAATVVLEPRETRDTWRIYSSTGADTPVKHLAINLGAPGDRRDRNGTLWLAYPRPALVGRLEFPLDIQPKLAEGGGFFQRNAESLEIAGTDTPWLFTSGARGLQRCELPLLGEKDAPATYTVKLYFCALPDTPASAPFDVKLQGQTVEIALDIAAAAAGPSRALVRAYSNIPVERGLVIELAPRTADAALLCAIEVTRE